MHGWADRGGEVGQDCRERVGGEAKTWRGLTTTTGTAAAARAATSGSYASHPTPASTTITGARAGAWRP